MRLSPAIGLALVGLGLLRIGYAQLLSVSQPRELERIDARFAGLVEQLASVPRDLPLGYLGVVPEETPGKRLAQASYALAPRILLGDRGDFAWVVVELVRPDDAAQVLSRANLESVWRSPDGRVLVAKRPAQRGTSP